MAEKKGKNARVYVTVLDAEGVERRVRAVDAREIVALGGSYVSPEEEAKVPELMKKEKKADPVAKGKKKAEE